MNNRENERNRRARMYNTKHHPKSVEIILPDVADPFNITLKEWEMYGKDYIDMRATVFVKGKRVEAVQETLI